MEQSQRKTERMSFRLDPEGRNEIQDIINKEELDGSKRYLSEGAFIRRAINRLVRLEKQEMVD